MTDSIKISLDLAPIAPEFLINLPKGKVNITDHDDPDITTKEIPLKKIHRSPLTNAGFEIRVQTFKRDLPVSLTASVNLPAVLVDQNLEHGLSVIAGCHAALELCKHFLATHGVPLIELKKLTLEAVDIQSVTLTYILNSGKPDTCVGVRKICEALFALHPQKKIGKGVYAEGTNCVSDSDGFWTAYCNKREFALRLYTPHAAKLKAHPDHAEFGAQSIRVELVLHGALLEAKGWNLPTAWIDAHANGLYQRIYTEYIWNGYFRMDENLRHALPDARDRSKLKGLAAKVLEGYLSGKDPRTASEFKALAADSLRSEQKAFSAIKREILQKMRIDVAIPWQRHQQIRAHQLKEMLIWENDWNPPAERISHCFCRENWSSLLEKLKAAVESACVTQTNQITDSNFNFYVASTNQATGEISCIPSK
jgi:hypothetical protein